MDVLWFCSPAVGDRKQWLSLREHEGCIAEGKEKTLYGECVRARIIMKSESDLWGSLLSESEGQIGNMIFLEK